MDHRFFHFPAKSVRMGLPVVLIGLFLGIALTGMSWLGFSASLVTHLSEVSVLILVGAGLVALRHYPSIPRVVLVLAVTSATALVYLFPELFAPGCNGMPRAFAECPLVCRSQCVEITCTNGKCRCTQRVDICHHVCPGGNPGGGGPNPPSISGTLACGQPGNGGWCKGNLSLNLSASDPQGYEMLVNGDVAGVAFACPVASGMVNCSVPLPDGTGTATYTATSSSTLTASGSTNWALDATPPQIDGSLSGSAGANGWFLSAVNYSAAATDADSGLGSFSCTLDGAPVSCDAVLVADEGSHTLVATVTDLAGNTSQATQAISIDMHAPTLDAGVSGVSGENGWYHSATLTATGTDSLSGLADFEYSLDGGAWTTFPGAYTIPDGKHTLDVRVSDVAGNITQAAQITAWVDSVKPEISVDLSGTSGKNGWYTSQVKVTATGSDSGSGLTSLEYSLDGNAWADYTLPLTLSDGTHKLSFYAKDKAGQFQQVDQTIYVDTRNPQISGSLKGTLGQNGWYVSNVIVTATAGDPTPGSGISIFTYTLDSASSISYTAPLTMTDGLHTLVLSAEDLAGLQYSTTQTIKVDTQPPSLTVTSSLPNWIQRTVTLGGIAGDSMSGLSKVEVSTDNGASWKPIVGSANWTYTWDTAAGADGAHVVRIHSMDIAGLVTERAFLAQVDNTGPHINAPDSWNAWDTVKLNASDGGSGLSDMRVEIFDPTNHERHRKIELDVSNLPMEFLWDQRFADGTLAHTGDYEVLITAVDNVGNVSRKTAVVTIPWGAAILPPPATATPMPSPLPTATATPLGALPTLQVTPTQVDTEPVLISFGFPETIWPVSGGGNEPAASPVHAASETSDFTTWLGSFFTPPTADPTTTGFSQEASPLAATSTSGDLDSGILWGAAAAASVASVTGYWLQKKREEDAARASENADDGGPDDTKARRKAAQKAKNDPDSAKAAALKSAIAAATAKEQKEWKTERYAQVSQTEEYKDSDDKTRFMHNELAKIKDNETYFRDKKKKEEAQTAWLRTGENPPVGMDDVSEAERLAMYQQTDEYKNYQAGMEKWGQEQKALQNWLRTGGNPPAGMEDVTEAERLAMYQQTDEYKNYQAGMAAWAAQQQAQDDGSYDAVERLRAANAAVRVPMACTAENIKNPQLSSNLFLNGVVDNSENIKDGIVGAINAYNVRGILLKTLDSGKISVSGSDAARAVADNCGICLPGPRYNPETVHTILSEGFVKSAIEGAFSPAAIATAGAFSAGINLYDYGKDHTSSWQDFSDATIYKKEFWVSTGVDTGISLATGLLAAVTVAVVLSFLAVTTAPVWLVVGGTALLGIGIGIGLEAFKVPQMIKDYINLPQPSSPITPSPVETPPTTFNPLPASSTPSAPATPMQVTPTPPAPITNEP